MSRRLIYADELITKFKNYKKLFLDGWGGFCNLPENDKARVDELDNCIAQVFNAPTIDAVELPLKIGEKCYCIMNYTNEIVEDVVDDYDIWSIKNGVKLRITLAHHNSYVIGEFGKGVFRTREEAEKARESKWKED